MQANKFGSLSVDNNVYLNSLHKYHPFCIYVSLKTCQNFTQNYDQSKLAGASLAHNEPNLQAHLLRHMVRQTLQSDTKFAANQQKILL